MKLRLGWKKRHNSLLKLTWRDDSEQRSSSSEFNVRRAGYEVNNMDDRKASDDLVLHYCSCAHLSTLAHACSLAICLIYLASSSSFTIGTFQNVWDGGERRRGGKKEMKRIINGRRRTACVYVKHITAVSKRSGEEEPRTSPKIQYQVFINLSIVAYGWLSALLRSDETKQQQETGDKRSLE